MQEQVARCIHDGHGRVADVIGEGGNQGMEQTMLLASQMPITMRSDSQFFSKYAALLDIALRLGDLFFVVVAACVAYAFRFQTMQVVPAYRVVIVLAALLTVLIFHVTHIYRSWRGESLIVEILRVWLAWAGVFVGIFVLSWTVRATADYSRLWVAEWFVAGAALFAIDRLAVRSFLRIIRRHGVDTRRVILVGATRAGQEIVEAARRNAWMGLNVIGFVQTEHDQVKLDGLPCLGKLDEFVNGMAAANNYEQLWIALPMCAEQSIRRVADAVRDTTATIRLIPDLFGYELLNQRVTEIAGVPIITLRGSRITGHAQVIKAVEDRVLSALILLCISPLMVMISVGVKLSSPGPVLFKQKRHGLHGKEVEVWKFRTMRIHHESAGQITQASKNDPRVTCFGRFLRKSSLDELPQFINVFMGTMSIVGPRPHAVEHDLYYQQLIDGYGQRNRVKPGITGWAQINGFRGETNTVEKMSRRIEYDVLYIKNWSLWLDIRIIVSTVTRGFWNENAY